MRDTSGVYTKLLLAPYASGKGKLIYFKLQIENTDVVLGFKFNILTFLSFLFKTISLFHLCGVDCKYKQHSQHKSLRFSVTCVLTKQINTYSHSVFTCSDHILPQYNFRLTSFDD